MVAHYYPAYRSYQTAEGKPLILFDAPAVEIEQWAGVPQRRRVADDQEEQTAGFQREEDPSRIRQITRFYQNHANIVQNPLLGALQDAACVSFEPVDTNSPFGTLKIEYQNWENVPLLNLLQQLARRLEARVDSLREDAVDESRIAQLFERESRLSSPKVDEEAVDDSDVGDSGLSLSDESADEPDDAGTIMLAEETQLREFYTELIGRIRILENRGDGDTADRVLGFTKAAVLEYLKPVALVDGQHRLRGATVAAHHASKEKAGQLEMLDAIDESVDPKDAEAKILLKHSRRLPVSLLLDESPSEHVFQFVVVNQKATPLKPALLGTIVATSLSRDELKVVADRLRHAGIKLEDSQAVTFLARAEVSPFKGVVQTGTYGDTPDMLQWTVLRGLVQIFRELRGARPYNQEKADYARAWRLEYLSQSGLVAAESDKDKLAEWSRPDGPWRDMFIRFYSFIRDEFGDVSESEAFNGWGSTKESNLFNKISLTILAADYFEFLFTTREPLASWDDFDRSLTDWLQGEKVSRSYFNRNWDIKTIKKDQLGVKKLWASNWSEYRKMPSIGMPKKFKP